MDGSGNIENYFRIIQIEKKPGYPVFFSISIFFPQYFYPPGHGTSEADVR